MAFCKRFLSENRLIDEVRGRVHSYFFAATAVATAAATTAHNSSAL